MADPMDMNAAFGRAVAEDREKTTAATIAEAEAVDRLNKRYGIYLNQVDQATRRNEQLRRGLKDGTFARHAAEVAQLNREYAELSKSAQLTQLVAIHGRFGGVIRQHQAEFGAMQRAGAMAYMGLTGMAVGLMHAGLRGTVEAYQLEQAWSRMGRQVAGIAVPAIDMVSKTVGQVATWFEKLSGSQQDVILKFGLMAVAAGPVLRIGTAIFGVMKGTAAVMASVRAAAGMSAAASAAGVAATAGGAGLAAGTASAGGATAAAAGGRATAAAGGASMLAAIRMMGVLALAVAPIAAAADAGDRLNASEGVGDYYSRKRKEGRSRLGAAWETGGKAISSLGYATGLIDETFSDDEKKKHRNVSMNQTSLLELGQTHQAIQEEVLKQTFARQDDEGGAAGAILEILKGWSATVTAIAAPPMSTE